jgi:hypothetical protein
MQVVKIFSQCISIGKCHVKVNGYLTAFEGRSRVKMGQKSKEFREKRENIIILKVGRSTRWQWVGFPAPGVC